MVSERRLRSGANGAGTYRGGQGLQTSFTPYCTDELLGQMLGTRQWLPLEGTAGGRPGATTQFSIISPDGTRRISTETDDVRLRSGETFEFVCASGGGVGDPLDRDPMSVLADLHDGYVSAEEAATVYGVAIAPTGEVDVEATARLRSEHLATRLRMAVAPVRPVTDVDEMTTKSGAPTQALYPGVVQIGRQAVVIRTGTVLSTAPDHWTDGCAVLEECIDENRGVIRSYLDPLDGRALFVEVVPVGTGRSFSSLPEHWTNTAAQ
jgi:N-methylhydantoinase B